VVSGGRLRRRRDPLPLRCLVVYTRKGSHNKLSFSLSFLFPLDEKLSSQFLNMRVPYYNATARSDPLILQPTPDLNLTPIKKGTTDPCTSEKQLLDTLSCTRTSTSATSPRPSPLYFGSNTLICEQILRICLLTGPTREGHRR
jgi:hypothetical protein